MFSTTLTSSTYVRESDVFMHEGLLLQHKANKLIGFFKINLTIWLSLDEKF